ncbi:hypothetical protein MDIS_02700 [Mesomycoplasma dispar]|nr:hypothetical protein MDIS_02700 [Mesomycoplasma dispar]
MKISFLIFYVQRFFFFFLMIFSTSNSIGIIFLLFFDILVLYDKFYQIRFTLKHKIFNIP